MYTCTRIVIYRQTGEMHGCVLVDVFLSICVYIHASIYMHGLHSINVFHKQLYMHIYIYLHTNRHVYVCVYSTFYDCTSQTAASSGPLIVPVHPSRLRDAKLVLRPEFAVVCTPSLQGVKYSNTKHLPQTHGYDTRYRNPKHPIFGYFGPLWSCE